MLGKLGLVGGVGLAWVLTFVFMGGDVLPALSSNHTDPTAGIVTQAGPVRTADPLTTTPAPGPSAQAAPQQVKAALNAEALAGAAQLAGSTLAARPTARRAAPPVLSFRFGTYNMLGSSHTRGSNKRASGPTRANRGAQYVLDNQLSVVGFQEMQADQRASFLRSTNNTYGLYPGNQLRSNDGETSLAYRLDTWELIKADTVSIPYFSGKPRNLPVLLLRNRQTGIESYFTDFHNPADKFGNAARWRAIAKQRQIALFQDLARTGKPVFVAGDMNEHRTWACDIVGPSDMRVGAGGDGRNGCSVRTNRIVDWIAASYDVQWINYFEDRGPTVDYLTDHPIIWGEVRIDSRDFPRSVS